MSSEPDPGVANEQPDAVAEGPVETAGDGVLAEGRERWPIGFMLTITMAAVYVGYRVIQLTVKFFQWAL